MGYAKKLSGVLRRDSGLQYRPIRTAPDDARKPGRMTPCLVHYRGILTDGTEFDSTYRKGRPAVLRPDDGVPGWSEALQLMREGEKLEVVLPGRLGYGEEGAGPIPQGAVLIFEIELLEVEAVANRQSNNSAQRLMLAFGLIAFAMLLFLYQMLTRSPVARRGPNLTLADVSSVANPRVFFDIEVGGRAAGRVEFELFAQLAPRTVENFRALATGEKGMTDLGVRLHYKGSVFHRIVPGLMCQGGDIASGNGYGAVSVYGGPFKDEWEHGVLHHTQPGLLSMANRGKDSNGCQFTITTAPVPRFDGKHVVFGRIARGMDVLELIEKTGTPQGTPSEVVVIVNSGELGHDSTPVQIVERQEL